jgi:hypothetical protein
MSTNPLKNNTTSNPINSQNLGNITEILTNLFNANMDSTSTKVGITELFQNPNMMLQTLQSNCSAVAELFTTANTTVSGADSVTYEESTGVNNTISTGLGDVNPSEVLNNVVAQTQSAIMTTCKLVADKALKINNLSTQMESIKTAMSSGDINQITQVYQQLTKSMNELISEETNG